MKQFRQSRLNFFQFIAISISILPEIKFFIIFWNLFLPIRRLIRNVWCPITLRSHFLSSSRKGDMGSPDNILFRSHGAERGLRKSGARRIYWQLRCSRGFLPVCLAYNPTAIDTLILFQKTLLKDTRSYT